MLLWLGNCVAITGSVNVSAYLRHEYGGLCACDGEGGVESRPPLAQQLLLQQCLCVGLCSLPACFSILRTKVWATSAL